MNTTCFKFPSAPPGQAVWVANSSCRGTFEIISLCLSTTVICIWSSVHRDIPLERSSTFRSLRRDLPLVLVALLAPELLFYFALQQFLCARVLLRDAPASMNFDAHEDKQGILTNIRFLPFLGELSKPFRWVTGRFGDPHWKPDHELQVERKGSERKYPFTMTHAFYAAMGGFAFSGFLDANGDVVEGRAKLTSKGVQFLMKHDPDLIPDLDLTLISDRSKSNNLGKALLIVQVAWFCLNCVSRLTEHLALSLLELSTLAHGLFTLSSYVMWWSKPMNIDEPTWIPITGDSTPCIHAREAMALMEIMWQTRRPDEEEEYVLLQDAIIRNRSPFGPQENNLAHPQLHQSGRVALAFNAAIRYGFTDINVIRSNPCIDYTIVPRFSDLFFAAGLRLISDLGFVRDYIIVVCITFMYGFLHFLGRNSPFPTTIERRLWIISSVIIMSTGVLEDSLNLVRDFLFSSLFRYHKAVTKFYSLHDVAYYRVIPFVYAICSGFLLVESVRQLWYLRPEAFVDASWAYYVPHWL